MKKKTPFAGLVLVVRTDGGGPARRRNSRNRSNCTNRSHIEIRRTPKGTGESPEGRYGCMVWLLLWYSWCEHPNLNRQFCRLFVCVRTIRPAHTHETNKGYDKCSDFVHQGSDFIFVKLLVNDLREAHIQLGVFVA